MSFRTIGGGPAAASPARVESVRTDVEAGNRTKVSRVSSHQRSGGLDCCGADQEIRRGHRCATALDLGEETRIRVGKGLLVRERDRQRFDEALHALALTRRIRGKLDAHEEFTQGVDAQAAFLVVGEAFEQFIRWTERAAPTLAQHIDEEGRVEVDHIASPRATSIERRLI